MASQDSIIANIYMYDRILHHAEHVHVDHHINHVRMDDHRTLNKRYTTSSLGVRLCPCLVVVDDHSIYAGRPDTLDIKYTYGKYKT